MPFSTEDMKEHLRWRSEMVNVLHHCEKIQAHDTLEAVKALILYADRQVEVRQRGKVEWIRVAMRKRREERELAVRRTFEREMYSLRECASVKLWSDGAVHA